MRVQVRLFASLRKYLPPEARDDTITVDVPEGATVAEVVSRLGIPDAHARMAVCGGKQVEISTALIEGQQVSLFPPLAGGS